MATSLAQAGSRIRPTEIPPKLKCCGGQAMCVVRQCGRLIHLLPSRTPRAISDMLVHVVGEMVRSNPPMMVATVVYIVLPQQCGVSQNAFAGLCLGPIMRRHTWGVTPLTY